MALVRSCSSSGHLRSQCRVVRVQSRSRGGILWHDLAFDVRNGIKYDLIVIGAGVLGTFHAYHALMRGKRVLMVERNSRPKGATIRNFGQVVPSGMDPIWQRLGRESLAIYKSIQQQSDITVRQQGTIYIASDQEESTLIEELHVINKGEGYRSELWTKEQCCKHYPLLNAAYCSSGLFFPEEVSVDPRAMIHHLHLYLRESLHLEIAMEACVHQLNQESSNVVAHCTDGRVFHAEKAVVCSGAEFRILFPDLFCDSGIEAVKLQMLMLAAQSEGSLPGNILTGHSIRRYESFAACPSYAEIKNREDVNSPWRKWGVHILFKQEPDGRIILGDSHEYAPADRSDELDDDIKIPINQFFIEEARKIMDLPNWEIERAWSGVYCQTKDNGGIFRRTVDQDIHIATAIGGKGMTASAGFAKQHLREIYGD